jgi:hypothetical protein
MLTVPTTTASRAKSPSRLTMRISLGLAAVLALAGVGCGDGAIWVYIDNGGDEVMSVTVDGKEVAKLPPGKFTRIDLEPGEHRFQVRSGDNTLCDVTNNLQPSDKAGVTRRYFFNPDNRNRYIAYTVRYGKSLTKTMREMEKGSVRRVYQLVLDDTRALPAKSWFEVPDGAYVLTSAPDHVMTRSGGATRNVMTRVDPEDHALLEQLAKKVNPTEEDLEELLDVVDRMMEDE